MAQETDGGQRDALGRAVAELLLPALVFGVGVGFATGEWPASLASGAAVSAVIYGLRWMSQRVLYPRLQALSRDWLHLGLEMTLDLTQHVLGASMAILACSRLFHYQVMASLAWAPVAGMVIAFPIVHGTEMALRFFRQLREKERREAQLIALAQEAELRALKAQINPHFLFNTLNTIASLIHTQPEQAEATIERLAEMFRYLLNGSERRLVPLEEELAFVDGYLAIERARFGERLRVTRQVGPEVLRVPVPGLILQPLVENAVQHGRGADGSVDLTIRATANGDEVWVAIADLGPGMDPGHGVGWGVGLRNVDDRLCKTYGPAYALCIRANEPHGTVVSLRIPVGGSGEPHEEARHWGTT
jgi:two-component system LytT family sensor kinase